MKAKSTEALRLDHQKALAKIKAMPVGHPNRQPLLIWADQVRFEIRAAETTLEAAAKAKSK
jgi:hypothetical protein